MKFTHCIQCPHHSVINDSDPSDWFNDDDCAVVCTKTKRPTNPESKYAADRQPYKTVAVACRPYQLKKESKVPIWCPLLK